MPALVWTDKLQTSGHKKTGPVSQGVTERPGEFSNWYFSSYLENSDVRLYPTHTENLKFLQRSIAGSSFQSCLQESFNHGS